MRLNLKQEWIGELLPEIEVPSLTVINGPSMSGMPMVEYTFISAWLKQGGNVLLIPIHHPSIDLTKMILKESLNLSERYMKQIIYVQFDPLANVEEHGNIIRANLLKTDVWDEIMEYGKNISNNLLMAAFGLGQLLFSPTYGSATIEKIKEIVRDDSITRLISPSSEKERFKTFPQMADNLILTFLKDHRAHCRIARVKNVSYSSNEIPLPFSQEIIKKIAIVVAKRKKELRPVLMKM